MVRRKQLVGVAMLLISLPVMAQRHQPDADVVVPPEAFATHGTRAASCVRCCVYQDKNYSEGAVVSADGGIFLQCQRAENTIGTNPLVWRRIKP